MKVHRLLLMNLMSFSSDSRQNSGVTKMDEKEFNDISDNDVNNSISAYLPAGDDAGFEIKKHNFEQYKEEIRAFANEAETDISISSVNSKKDVGEWFAEWLTGGGIGGDHKVTGKEFNDLVGEVQNCFLDTSKSIRNIMSGFMKVYDTFESLDNDYIKSILINVNRIGGESSKRSDEVKKLASVIKKFKNQFDEEVDALSDKLDQESSRIDSMLEFIENLKELEHLGDVDDMYDRLYSTEEAIHTLRDEVDSLTLELEQKRSDTEKLSEIIESTHTMNKKIRFAYIVAGSSLGLTLIELIIIMAKVIF